LLREPVVKFQASRTVCVSIYLYVDVRIRDQDSSNFCQALSGGRLEIRFSGVEQNVGHIHDQPSRGVPGFQDLIQLLQHAGPHLGFIAFRLLARLVCLLSLLRGLLLR
jgi:hypothetical protein